ncbi:MULTISPECIES: hypothetical protein [Thalassospira]|uniref:Uncharacterized protein n=1 Tax=Thalassospira profundimaris TaxID=502049 RepID=A0A367V6Y3_9PROT|nr:MULTISPECIES: hypothetical protein [Thalassospira]KZB70464.1 hypothetical protein AUQ43_14130 [Thalassospira sp. MCCC 1A01148]MBR9901775.1 hypothetical protein [Rhodospirillales bacterium]RCK20893.1 hypothetical protein TH6_14000 [Thalassospira profundimaris]
MEIEKTGIWKSSFCAISNKKWMLLLIVLPVLVSSVLRVDYSFEDTVLHWVGAVYLKLLKFAAIYSGVVWVLQLGRSCTKTALFFSAVTLFSIDALLWLIRQVNVAFSVGDMSWQGMHLLSVSDGDVTGALVYASVFAIQEVMMFAIFILLAMLIPPLLSYGRVELQGAVKIGWLMRGFIAKGVIIGLLPLWLLHEGAAMILPGILVDTLVWLGGAGENLYRLKGAALAVTVLSQFLTVLMNVMVGVILARAYLKGGKRVSKAITASDM